MSGESEVPTLGEIGRRLTDVAQRLETLATRMEQTYVRLDVFEAAKQMAESEHAATSDRVEKLESRQEWIVRTVGFLVISAVLGLVFYIAQTHPGH